jgi:ABC-2 type transport system ATP-binding protein
MDVVETRGLFKRYGAVEALRGVDLRVPEASLFGFLGPNGAGKSTTIRILSGLLRGSAGAARVLGYDAWRQGPLARAEIGYLPGDVRFYDQLTCGAYLRFVDSVRGAEAMSEGRRLAQRLGLELDKRVRACSRGAKQKLGLIAAMMHRPRLLILDEPTTALDPLVRHELFDELRAVASDGRTVLFSSHTLAEVEELCSDVAIVRAGRVIEQASMRTLRARALRHVEMSFEGAGPRAAPPAALRVDRRRDGWLAGAWLGEVGPLIGWLSEQPVRDVSIAPPSLEDLFIAYYAPAGADARGAADGAA